MGTGRVLRLMSLSAVLALLAGPPRPAGADSVVADDQIVQGNLCVGTPCADGEVFPLSGGQLKVKGTAPFIRFEDTSPAHAWHIFGDSVQFVIADGSASTVPFAIAQGAPTAALSIAADGSVGLGPGSPSQPLHVRRDQNANTFFLVQNATNDLSANAVVRTQADTAIQNFQSHASSRTLARWGVPLGGWNEFLSVVGTGLAMGTLGNAPFVLGTGSTARMTFDGDSNVIAFGGGGVYNGANFLDASSRALKQDVQPLEGGAAATALAALEPVTYAYRAAPGERHAGFIAEDVPALVATPDRRTLSALEIVAVLTKVVQEQQQAIAELIARITALETRP